MKKNTNTLLVNQYSGNHVTEYENIRHGSLRWAEECRSFSRIIDLVKPNSLLDCPVGTCRWAKEYARIELVELHGLDASLDMLDRATSTAKSEGLQNFDFRQADLLEADALSGVPQVDLIVCVRFLNWLNPSQVETLIKTLSNAGSKFLVVGISVTPSKWTSWRKLITRTRLWLDNLRRARKGLAPIYVHEEAWFDSLVSDNHLAVEKKDFIFEDSIRSNFFYLLRPNQDTLPRLRDVTA